MRLTLFGSVLSLLVGCATSDTAQPEGQQAEVVAAVTATALPMTSGSFKGSYVVPGSADLASASTFAMAEVDWTVTAGVVTLHYDLPVGLVGGDMSVTLTAPLAAGTTSAQLSGTAVNVTATGSGTGTCTAAGTNVTCSESFANMGTLPMSTAVVASTAQANNVPVASAQLVSTNFFHDPIGTVSLDLSRPADDGGGGGHGKGHGGGGGGGGGGRH